MVQANNFSGNFLSTCECTCFFNYAIQRTAQRISILAHFLISAPCFIQRQSALAHFFAVAEGRKTCFCIRKAFLPRKIAFFRKKSHFSAKKSVLPRKKAIFATQRTSVSTSALGYQRIFFFSAFFIQRQSALGSALNKSLRAGRRIQALRGR